MQIIRLTVLIIVSVFCLQTQADDNKEASSNVSIYFLKRGGDGRTDKPRMPSRQCVYGIYDGENLYIEFSIPEGMCDMAVSDSYGFEQTYQFDSNSPSVTYVGEVETAEITITTSCGNVYEGSIGDW